MTDNNSGDNKTLSVAGKKPLSLKPSGAAEQSTVRQKFSHGRTHAVVVETKRRKFTRPGERDDIITPVTAAPAAPAPQAAPAPAPRPAAAPVQTAAPAAATPAPRPAALSQPQQQTRPAPQVQRAPGASTGGLNASEMDARRRALDAARIRDVEERRRAAEEAARREQERAREDAERAKLAAEAAREAAEATVTAQVAEVKRRPEPAPVKAKVAPVVADDDEERARRRGAANAAAKPGMRAKVVEAPAKPARTKTDDARFKGKLTVTRVTGDDDERSRSVSAMRRRVEKMRRAGMQQQREKVSREVQLPETITIQELAQRMTERSVDVIKFLMQQGQMLKPGDIIDADMAELIASEFGHTVRRVTDADVETGIFEFDDTAENRVSRPPVVTIMGHVDHGKTSLLDAIRATNVVSGEAGGITQHIGAYQVERNNQKITFIDTPGHEAFTAMRARGAQATDIAILVVAADDSVMPQTIESINHAKAARVPIIVAINKIDKPSADAQKVRTQLLQHEVFVESMGGDVLDVEVSAVKGTGLDKLLEAILLQSELLDLKANPDRPADGVVIESQLDKGRGPVATVLVKGGTLKQGDIVVAGAEWGRVRALVDEKGTVLKSAPPAMPVEVLGLSGAPSAGDRFTVVENEAKAREITEYRQRLAREKASARQVGQRGSLEQMMNQLQVAGVKEFPLVIKGDVQGSIEAIAASLEKLNTAEVRARIVHSGVGGITESDISLAEASNAAVIGFSVRANKQARDLSERAGIEIRYYNIIYNLLDDIKAAMSGMLSPERRETFLGNAEILEVFNITKVGKVAGCRVTEGKVERGAGVRLIRDNVVIHEGTLKTLKRFKDEVSEVYGGQECGMAFANYEDIRQGDIIECFRVQEIARSL
ncbi:MAG: translation initiation factor IF-2 [Rhizobiaceae bacterium]|nr:translation initiation factor IF-2 [Rhizobiaceae bacterium]